MNRTLTILLTAALAVPAARAAPTPIAFDNGISTNLLDTTTRLTSERGTQIGIPTWTVDDFQFDLGGPRAGGDGQAFVEVNSVEWIGVREIQNRPGFGYDVADVAIFTRSFDQGSGQYDFTPVVFGGGQIALFMDVSWTEVANLGTLPNDPDRRIYHGSVDLPAVPLDPFVDYWVGVRLVGNPDNPVGGTAGRNQIVATDPGHPNPPFDESFNFDPAFGSTPWAPSSARNPFSDAPIEVAYKINGLIVPEPASLMLLVIGGIAMVCGRRR